MKKSDVKTWVKALRSGDYQQSKEHLCEEDYVSGDCTFCCLGVACDVLTEADWIKFPEWTVWSIGELEDLYMTNIDDKYEWGLTETTSFPSQKILKEMGPDAGYAQELAELNDRGWSFERIANKIEKDLL